MATRHDRDLQQLNRTLESAGIELAAVVRDNVLFLSGAVDSARNHLAALDIVGAVADDAGWTIDDSIEVLDDDDPGEEPAKPSEESGDFAYQDPDTVTYEGLDAADEEDGQADRLTLDPDFTGDIGTTNPEVAAAEGVPYFPPTDPVVRVNDDATGGLEVVGGFDATSMDDLSATDDSTVPGDADITEAVMRELREDSLTTDMVLQADTRRGVVYLRGTVETMEDAENAEAVARRVEGVQDVDEQLTVLTIEHREP